MNLTFLKKNVDTFFILCILTLTVIFHLHAINGNNYYFTVDQGRDAVFVRNLVETPQLILKGPETSIRGVFTGPLWFYFLGIGYVIGSGNPIYSVYLMVLLQAITLFVVYQFLRKRINSSYTILITTLLTFQWAFFETALWAFNPFPLVLLSFWLIMSLTKFLEGQKIWYAYGIVPVLLSFNTDLAGAAVFLILYIGVGIWGFLQKKISTLSFIIFTCGIPILGILYVLFQFLKTFEKAQVTSSLGQGLGVFTGLNVIPVTNAFSKIIATSIFPYQFHLGILLFSIVTYLYAKSPKKNQISTYIVLSSLLLLISYLFFITNKGFRSWHVVYIPPLLVFLYLSMVSTFEKTKQIFFVGILAVGTLVYFSDRFQSYLKVSPDTSLMYNRIAVLDWIYTNNDEDGFNLYTYTDSFYDYPSQYLVWWYGKNTYGFVPCEYANYPKSPKETYVFDYYRFSEPRLGCTKLRFLIIESSTNGQTNSNWLEDFQKAHTLSKETTIGSVRVEKRTIK